jgi:hypothetical protein
MTGYDSIPGTGSSLISATFMISRGFLMDSRSSEWLSCFSFKKSFVQLSAPKQGNLTKVSHDFAQLL